MALPRTYTDPVDRLGSQLTDFQVRIQALERVAHAHGTNTTGIWYQRCLSSSRPTPAEGLMIYETDTDRILVYDGTGWVILSEPSVSFTPSVSGLTVGDGSWSARYRRSDGWIDVEGSFTFGLTSAIVSGLTMTLPIGSATTTPDLHSVSFYDFDTNSQYVAQATYVGTTTTVALRAVSASSAYAVTQGISATVPFTWTKDDLIQFGLRYRMASRYS